MRYIYFLPCLVLLLVACGGPPPPSDTNTSGGDPAYHFTAGDVFVVDFAERLTHTPRTDAEAPSTHSTYVRLDMRVVEVDKRGAAHLHFVPTESRYTVTEGDRPPIVQAGVVDRGRDRFDLSPGVRYLRDIGDYGLHALVDATGRWQRDFRGGPPPADFLSREQWSQPPAGLTIYPRREMKQTIPTLMGAYLPTNWRKQPEWSLPFELAPPPPMTGLIPLEWVWRIAKREGSHLFLGGTFRKVGKESAKSPFGLVQLGDVTIALRFQNASYQARFDLELGLPIETRQEFHWATQRYVDGFGEVISDDAQVLTFRLRPRQ
ncbi:MAG: hypothetical protein P9L99_06360 [Candidatus Lernaella stagnicola]|nr:hypothetical protein [Candidatus Lernaella stagnicola]